LVVHGIRRLDEPEPAVTNLQQLIDTVAALRAPGGCPWDREQTLESMRPYLLEEVYELLDAIDQGSTGLSEELGDVLFIVLLLCQIGADEGRFDLEGVAIQINDKMIVRHPHVFGTPEEREGPGGTIESWEQLKAKLSKKKTQRRSRLDGVPASMPALLRAFRVGEKASAVGFDWPDVAGVLDKVREELAELEEALQTGVGVREEYGDLLLSTAHVGRHIGAPPEEVLREANNRFAARFRGMEALAASEGIDLAEADAQTLDDLWERIKAAGD
jgi:MazG family protein